LDQADVTVACCERTKLKSLLEGKGKNLKSVVLFEDLTDADRGKYLNIYAYIQYIYIYICTHTCMYE